MLRSLCVRSKHEILLIPQTLKTQSIFMHIAYHILSAEPSASNKQTNKQNEHAFSQPVLEISNQRTARLDSTLLDCHWYEANIEGKNKKKKNIPRK